MFKIFRFFKKIKAWHFLVLTIVSLIVCIFALRANNLEMVNLRQALYMADKNNQNVAQALDNLQKYVTSHMNTSLTNGNSSVYPPIQLKYTYQRLLNQQGQTLNNDNSQIYTEAENYCQAKIPNGFSGRYRVPCIEQFISSHKLATPTIPASLYEFDFISPAWSPDLAGWSLLVTLFLGICFVVKLFLNVWNKYFNS